MILTVEIEAIITLLKKEEEESIPASASLKKMLYLRHTMEVVRSFLKKNLLPKRKFLK